MFNILSLGVFTRVNMSITLTSGFFLVSHTEMTEYTLEQRDSLWLRFEKIILPAGKTWQNLNGKDMTECVNFLMNRVMVIPRRIRCENCGHCMYYSSSNQRFRCTRTGCKFGVSWTNGTIFFNLRNGLKCAHIVGIFVARLVFEDFKSPAEWATRFNIPVSWVEEYFTGLETILDSWKKGFEFEPDSELPLPAEDIVSLTGYEVFLRLTPLDSRIPWFF